MFYTLILENETGQQIDLSKTANRFMFSKIEGLNPPAGTISTSSYAGMDGSYLNNAFIEKRNVVIPFEMRGFDVELRRHELYKVVKPSRYIKIYYSTKNISVYAEGIVETCEMENFEMLTKGQISIICPDIYWYSTETQIAEYAQVTGAFHFIFPDNDEPFPIGKYNTQNIMTIVNDGDEVGFTLEISGGPATNPTIYNAATDEYMQILGEIQEGDLITITTKTGNKTVTLEREGVVTNIINRLVSGSTWLTLRAGENKFYGGCFNPTASKLKLAIASGKAWIDGHYFISDTAYTFDLSRYVDESLPRYVIIGICCNTGENFRSIEFELSVGTPATNPTIPKFVNTDTKTYLTLFAVKIEAGAIDLKVTDYRNNYTYCGYVRCILGKCKVTDMLSQLDEILEQMKDYNTTITQLTNKVDELTVKVDEMTGDVIAIGKCGEDINYVWFSDGRVILKGTGAMCDYGNFESDNKSPFYDSTNVKSVIVSEGITVVGEYAFTYCNNLKTATLPTTLTAIKRNSFIPHIDGYIPHRDLYGLTTLKIPSKVTELGRYAFAGTQIQSVTVPASVVTAGDQVFGECQNLKTVRYSGKVISDRMFVRCINLTSFTITKSCKEIVGGCFNYCDSLTTLTYEGSITQIAKQLDLSVNTVKSFYNRNKDKQFCLFCGASIEQPPRTRLKKFCSDKCRLQWWYAHAKDVNRKAMYDFTCACCGKPFQAYGNNHRKYCSRSCYMKARFCHE